MAELAQHEKELFGKSRTTGDRPPPLRHGRYVLLVERYFLHRGYRNVLSDVKNFIVLKAEKRVVMEDDRKREDIPNEVDSRVGVTYKFDGPGAEMAPINSTRFMLALMGFQDNEINDNDKVLLWQRLTNDDPKKYVGEKYPGTDIIVPSINPMRGMLIAAETVPIFTKKNGKWIVGINFLHIARPGEGENSYQNAAKRWAEYETKLKAVA